jgi:hypothetical protein
VIFTKGIKATREIAGFFDPNGFGPRYAVMLFTQASFAIVYCGMLSISPFTDGILMDSFDLDVE